MSILVTASMAAADPKPANSTRADSQSVANFYVGTSRIWESCKGGGVYFGAGWEAKAYCNKNTPAVGIGKWSVKKGAICTDIVWHWKEGAEVKSKRNDSPDCIAHVTDPNGKMWRRWNKDADWWSLQDIKASKGFQFKAKFNRMSKKLGI